jgi:hypothetical protein
MADSDDEALAYIKKKLGGPLEKHHFRISASPPCIQAVGYIALQWAALMATIELQLRILGSFPEVPKELYSRPLRKEATYQISRFIEIGQYYYRDKREGEALRHFDRLASTIDRTKGDRDRLVHGTYAQMDNPDPSILVVYYKEKRHRYPIKRLLKIAHEISICNGTLMHLWEWADLDKLTTSQQKSPSHSRPHSDP